MADQYITGTRYVVKSGGRYYSAAEFANDGFTPNRAEAFVFAGVDDGWHSPPDNDGNRGWAKAVAKARNDKGQSPPARVVRLVPKKAVA